MKDPAEQKNDAVDHQPIRYINLYESEQKVYTRKISGFYQSIRRYTGLPLLLGFVLLPWLVIDGRPAVLFDLPQRQFHILWTTFGPQEGMLLAWLLIISAFGLFTVTAVWGRVWCGFTCPQTVWTLMFIWVEHVCEGDRNQRIKLDSASWSVKKGLRKGNKYTLWGVISFITGATFIGYFYPIRDLLFSFVPVITEAGLFVFDGSMTAVFWTLLFAGLTYMNAGFLREQVCKYMCPYARFQSVMYDSDTLAVHYDATRGEQRGPRKPGLDQKPVTMGDCTDCSWCVQVCPVDIDIRDGLQYECINCGLCVDACDAVMDKMAYPRGLISFTSDDQLATGKTNYIRPRVFGYIALLAVMIAAFSYTIIHREPVTLDIDRDRSARMYRIQGDKVQNVYTLKVHNMDRLPHTFSLQIKDNPSFRIIRYKAVPIEPYEIYNFPVRIEASRRDVASIKTPITLVITSTTDKQIRAQEQTVFISPDN